MKSVMKIFILAMTAALVVSVFAALQYVSFAQEITVELDGKVVEFDIAPKIKNGSVLVPMRKIFEEIGATVKWDGDTKTALARKGAKTVSFTVGSENMKIEKGSEEASNVSLETAAEILGERVLVPVRAVSETFNFDVYWDSENSTVFITSEKDDDSWKENKAEINLSELSFSGEGAKIDGKQITITSGGDYTLTGTLSGGNIKVDTKDKVKLRLSGVTVETSDEPCIDIENADKVYITLEGENTLTAENSEKGAVYSKDNLEIKGSGTLALKSNAGHGIKSTGNLTIENGTIVIDALNDAIHVNNTFKMKGGSIETTSGGDGIDSESIVIIDGGTINITSTAAPAEVSESQNPFEATSVTFENSAKGIKADWMMIISGGEITVNASDHAIHSLDEIEISGGKMTLYSEYNKGISGHGNVTVSGKDTVIDIIKSTEGIESKEVVTINDGTIKIIASDDAINGGGTGGLDFGGDNRGGGAPPMQNGGSRSEGESENKSEGENKNEGESEQPPRKDFGQAGGEQQPPQNNGDFQPGFERGFEPGDNNQPPKAVDGQSDTNDTFSGGNRPQRGDGFDGANMQSKQNLKDVLVINGGNIEVEAGDDCLDANGNIVINGGFVKANEPRGSASGFTAVLDADGSVTISENALLLAAVGSGSAPKSFTAANSVMVYLTQEHSNEKVTVSDISGKTVCEYTPTGSFNSVWFFGSSIKTGESYTVKAGSESFDFTAEDGVTEVGTQKSSGYRGGNFGSLPQAEKLEQK